MTLTLDKILNSLIYKTLSYYINIYGTNKLSKKSGFWLTLYFRLFTSYQKKTNCYRLTHHTWKMSLHCLVKCTFSYDWRYAAFLQTLVVLKRIGCDVRQMECQANNVTSVRSDHLLHGYMLPVFFCHWSTASSTTLSSTTFSPCRNKTLPQLARFADWYSISRYTWKNGKRWKICAFYKPVWWHFSSLVGKGVTVCFLLK